MKYYIGADHAGIEIKAYVKELFEKKGHTVEDLGPFNKDRVDYPDFAKKVCEAVLENKDTKEAVKKLRELAGDTTSSNNNFFSFPQHNLNKDNQSNKIIDYEIKPLNNQALIKYLQDRKIDYRASQGYLKEIYTRLEIKLTLD